MTPLTIATHRAVTPARRPVRRRVALARTIDSEFTKLRSLRSTYWTLFLLVLSGVAWCVVFSLGTVHQRSHMSAQDQSGFDATQNSIIGLAMLGQLVIVVLGVLMITSEYSTGTVRTSLTVMPTARDALRRQGGCVRRSQPGRVVRGQLRHPTSSAGSCWPGRTCPCRYPSPGC